MAKDRFNRFKPVNWNSDFKKTGNIGSNYNILDRTYSSEAYKANAELKQQLHQRRQLRKNVANEKLRKLYLMFEPVLNPWEKNFIFSLTQSKNKLSDKQKNVLKKIVLKYPEQADKYFTEV